MSDNEFDHDSVQKAADESVDGNQLAINDGRVQMLKLEYERLAHAMQSGVAHLMQHNPAETEPKHLRVGVNSALVSSGALVKLLMDKGLITELEYWETLVQTMREDVASYERMLAAHYGGSVTLS